MRLDRFITLNLVRPLQCLRSRLSYPRQSDKRGAGGEGCNAQPSAFSLQPSALGGTLPILMYHSISDDPEPNVSPYYRVCTGPQRFREQMQWLKDNGYQGVTLSTGLAWLNSNINSLSARSAGREGRGEVGGNSELRTPNSELRMIVLTFDDGFRDFCTHAFPILQPQGFSATMYLPTAFIGSERRSFKLRECL